MTPAIEMKGMTRFFTSTQVLANDHVDFSVESGEVHALVGENGAGKTTLMNTLYGLVKADSGEIFIDSQKVQIGHPDDAIRHGLGMVHQHFKLVPSFTVAQNILLGMEPTRAGFVNEQSENEMVEELAAKYNLPVDPSARIRDLPVGMQQRVEILKVLERKARILILDEPTAVLTPQEVNELITVIRGLSKQGYTILFITHKLIEVMNVADRVSVMRGGRMIGTKKVSETSISELAKMMVGREVLLRVRKDKIERGEPVLDVRDISVADVNGLAAISHVSFQVHQGEIVAIAGVSGNGQTELVEVIAGMNELDGGEILFKGKSINRASVGERREMGMAHIPEDRLVVGLNLQTTLDENLIVSRYNHSEFSRYGFLLMKSINEFAEKVVKAFSISAAQPGEGISMLSGGNLQKVVVGRELTGKPAFIIANQPTRGLDVGSIEFVHKTLIEERDRGAGVLLVSVELDEVLALSDRILVLYRGRIQGELQTATTTEEEVGILMAGGTLEDLKPRSTPPRSDALEVQP
ncbi:MAG TPA: ABC transporter ATP-binding protein [Anaerolineales bacterium]|nr:ABC transporter ATP-binding protein [Anaerolineales bacterium]